MSETFDTLSQTIATDFIQSILFVDDKAFEPDQSDHPFDVKSVLKESAVRGLIATALAPEQPADINHIAEIGKKADVIVLDWRMDINEDSVQEEDDEEEDGIADSRGNFAIQAIKKLISDNGPGDTVDQLKLIFIYTGEKGLQAICERLKEELDDFKQLDDFTFSYGGIRISIWAKEILASAFKHVEENKKRLRSYKELLDEVPIEYAAVSSGLLSNTCLTALTSLRNNIYTLLARFSPNLDPAFVAHRAMLPSPDDAGDLLKDTICGEVNSILTNANVAQRVSNKNVCDWISSQDFVDIEITINKKKKITINNTKRKLWQTQGYVELLNKEQDTSGEATFTDKIINNSERGRLKEHACISFTPQDFPKADSNEEFSILTHHKRNTLSTAQHHSLSLGVVVKNDDRYLLCIQQKCDSVRIPEGSTRKFLFLPMKPSKQAVDVLVKDESDDYVQLSICYKECHNLEIVIFAPLGKSGIVTAQEESDGSYCFVDGVEQKKYKWILELKEAHAQKIANNFAAQLSRVGLDESEWLRRT